jgi:tetratricopeptide (TPR) repeat protein/transcriptional regulator with XRE-family HTH domain
MIQALRSLVISILALWKGLSQKQIADRSGLTQQRVSHHLKKETLEEPVYQRLLRAVEGRPAEVALVTQCLEGLEGLRTDRLTVEEQDAVELGVLDLSQLARQALTEAALASRDLSPAGGCPKPSELEPARWLAGLLWKQLEPLPDNERLLMVRVFATFQTWALVERLCKESVVQASRDLERSAALAQLAREVADRVAGPEGWRLRVQGFAAGHAANPLRVAGKLKAADALMEEAKRLWHAGSDPEAVLDPGRLLDLEASLRRDQRRFEEALTLLDEATELSRCPVHTLINKGFTLEAMGQYGQAVETLQKAEPLAAASRDPRLSYTLCFNRAVNCTHMGRYAESAELLTKVREAVTRQGDENEISRITWLDGRIAAGLGRPEEARAFLAQARQGFASRGMVCDAALAFLEEAALLLEEGRAAEVKALARGLGRLFAGEGLQGEARAAVELFQKAAEREEATAALARRILAFLFRARYDPGLLFEL